MNNVKFDAVSWEEMASAFPRKAKDIERLMVAMYYRFQHGKVDTSDVSVIADEYFRRAQWHRPINLAATANHCASKGWLTESGKSERRKLWRITRKGFSHIKEALALQETQEKEHI
jgi:hypothetical protein